MKVYVFATVNLDGATYSNAEHHVDGKKLLGEASCKVIFDGHLSRGSVEMLSDEDGVEEAMDSLLISYAFRLDGVANLPARVIECCKMANISITPV